jgi:hypothetical protein
MPLAGKEGSERAGAVLRHAGDGRYPRLGWIPTEPCPAAGRRTEPKAG